MKTTLPVREKRLLENGEVEVKDYDIDVDIDYSLYAQIRFEQLFPLQANQESFDNYITRIFEIKENTWAVLVSKLKAFYCIVDTDIEFTKFVKMFSGNLTDKEYQDKLFKKMQLIVNAFQNGSAEKN